MQQGTWQQALSVWLLVSVLLAMPTTRSHSKLLRCPALPHMHTMQDARRISARLVWHKKREAEGSAVYQVQACKKAATTNMASLFM
jgi:hypothetical protein